MKIQLRKIIIQRFAAIKLPTKVFCLLLARSLNLEDRDYIFSDTWADFHLLILGFSILLHAYQ
jgi:hypothetical protein